MIFLSDEDAPPPWKRDVSIDVESVTLSSELLSSPPSIIHQNLPPLRPGKAIGEKMATMGVCTIETPVKLKREVSRERVTH